MNTLNNQYINPFAHDGRGKKWTQEKIKVIIELFEIHKTVFRVAKILSETEFAVKTILNTNGFATPTRKQFVTSFWKHYEDLQNPKIQQEIIAAYNNGLSAKEIGKQFEVSTNPIRKIIREHKAQRNLPVYIDKLEANKDKIISLFKQGIKFVDIAKQFECSSQSLRSFIFKHTKYTRRKKAKTPISIEDIENVYRLHHDKLMTLKQIGELYGCSSPCVRDFFDKHKIPRRSKIESVRLKNHDEANLINKLQKLKSRKPYTLPSGRIIKVMGYENLFLDFVFNNHILHEDKIVYNVPSIQYTENDIKRRYIPDFYIPKYNLIVEIKSLYVIKRYGGICNLLCKRKGVLNAGFDFCLVLDNKFDFFLAKISKTSFE